MTGTAFLFFGEARIPTSERTCLWSSRLYQRRASIPMSESLMNTYKRLPVTFTRGEGALLWDAQGNEYLDALSGIAVTNLGHAHPAVTKAVCEQAGRLLHTSNLYGIAAQEALGEALTGLAGMQRAFFGNSGAEANEAAIKLARLYGHKKGIKAPAIAVMENSFHGRTLATLSATGNRKVQAGFEPLVQGFVRVPYGDAAALHAVAENHQDIRAIAGKHLAEADHPLPQGAGHRRRAIVAEVGGDSLVEGKSVVDDRPPSLAMHR